MNSKTLVFIVFAVWSAICWRWYVCSIKQVCEGSAMAAVNNTQGTGVAPSDSSTTAEIQPLTHSNDGTQPISESKMNEVQMELVEDRMVIHFPYNSIRKEDNDAIDDYLGRLAAELISSGATVTIAGHTDFVGGSNFNRQFGQLRANSIQNILIKKGVSKSQIKTSSYGERKAIATNDTPWGRYKNRRVEIRIK